MPTETQTVAEESRHKCLIYDGDPSEQLPVVIPFLRESLQTNWRCLYIGSPEMVGMVTTGLAGAGIDAARETRRGALVLSSERSLAPDGAFDPGLMVDGLTSMIDNAVKDGFEGLSATGDMLWELGRIENFDRLLEYEARLEQAFRGKPLRGICQYQRDLVPPDALRHALSAHRGIYVGESLNQDNLFYIPPELLLEHNDAATAKQGEWMCQQIVRVLTAEQKRDEALRALQNSESQQRFLAEQLAEMNRTLERRVSERTAELEIANRHLESFSYSVSHDLSGPLQSIVGFSELLTDQFGEALGDKGRQHLQRMHAGALRMRELIDALLTLAGAARSNLEYAHLDISAMAEEVLREVRERDPRRSVDVVIQPGLAVVGDRVLIRAALYNLFGNAWKFTSKSPRARIEFGRKMNEAGENVFFIADNGAGFEMRKATKLFSAFQRLHPQEDFPGTGVGLATVQRIIARHGGRIWAEGRPNQGATFFFTLPGQLENPRLN